MQRICMSLLLIILLSACAHQILTSPPTYAFTSTIVSTPTATMNITATTVMPTPTELVDLLAGPKPEGQDITLDIQKHRWKNAEGKYWSPELNEWVTLRNAGNMPIYLLGGPTDFYGWPLTSPMYIYFDEGVLPNQGAIAHPVAYDTEFSSTQNYQYNSLPTQLAAYLTEYIKYPRLANQLTWDDFNSIKTALSRSNPSVEFIVGIPSNVRDPKTATQYTCDLAKGYDVIFTSWDKANPEWDHSFYETYGIRWKFNCDISSHRIIATVAIEEAHKVLDPKLQKAILAPLLTEIIDRKGKQESYDTRVFSDEVLAVVSCSPDNNCHMGDVYIKNAFLESVNP